jgi:dTDP-glucose pyrophosphorylase
MNIRKDYKWKKNLLNKNSKIINAIKILNIAMNKIVLVKDDKNKLIGTITNGDVRRGLIRGYTKKDSIFYILNKKPITSNINYSKKKILSLMIKNKINSIPIIDNPKHIKGLYYLLDKKRNINKDSIVLIMAGGKGKRLLPLTKKTPKPMLKISGIPMAERLIVKASREGFKNFVFSVNYLSEKIINYFKDGSKWGVNIDYIKEKKPMGTIGCLSYLENFRKKNVIVINCDVITKLKLYDFINFHLAHKQIATVASIIHETKNQFGIIKTSGSRLVEFVEKPSEKNYVNAGIYAFNKKIAKYINKKNRTDVNELFKKLIKEKKKIIVYPLHEPWADIGVHNELKKVNK